MRMVFPVSVVLFAMVMVSLASTVSAANVDITGSDASGDISDSNIDVVGYGAKIEGSDLVLWIEVKGSIYTSLPSKYSEVVYTLTLKDDDTSDAVVFTYQIDDTGSGATVVSSTSSEIVTPSINGGRCEVRVSSGLVSSFGTRYSVTASGSANGDMTLLHDYGGTYYSYKDPDLGNENTDITEEDFQEIQNIMFVSTAICVVTIVIIIVIIGVVIYLIVRKKPSQQPQQQYNYQQPQQYNYQQPQQPQQYNYQQPQQPQQQYNYQQPPQQWNNNQYGRQPPY